MSVTLYFGSIAAAHVVENMSNSSSINKEKNTKNYFTSADVMIPNKIKKLRSLLCLLDLAVVVKFSRVLLMDIIKL